MTVSPLSLTVLVGSASRSAGGLFSSVRHSAIALNAIGWEVEILSLTNQHAHDDLLAWKPLRPRLFQPRKPHSFAYAPELSQALKQSKSDVLHLHGIWQHLSIQTMRWRQQTGRPVMISPRGMLDPWAIKNSGLKKRLARLLYEDANLRGASCIHALNASEANSVRAFGLTNPIAVIPNGVDIPDLASSFDHPVWLPGNGRRTLLFIGRLHPKKGLGELISAWATLQSHAPNIAQGWQLVIAGWGDGGYVSSLEKKIVSAGLENDIILSGPVYGDEKAALLEAADAFILPSYSEGLPMAVLEAWAYALPVFMTVMCNLPEGFAMDAAIEISTKPEEIAAVLADSLNDNALSDHGQKGRELAKRYFSWSRIAEQHASVYHWLVRGGEAPDCVQKY